MTTRRRARRRPEASLDERYGRMTPGSFPDRWRPRSHKCGAERLRVSLFGRSKRDLYNCMGPQPPGLGSRRRGLVSTLLVGGTAAAPRCARASWPDKRPAQQRLAGRQSNSFHCRLRAGDRARSDLRVRHGQTQARPMEHDRASPCAQLRLAGSPQARRHRGRRAASTRQARTANWRRQRSPSLV